MCNIKIVDSSKIKALKAVSINDEDMISLAEVLQILKDSPSMTGEPIAKVTESGVEFIASKPKNGVILYASPQTQTVRQGLKDLLSQFESSLDRSDLSYLLKEAAVKELKDMVNNYPATSVSKEIALMQDIDVNEIKNLLEEAKKQIELQNTVAESEAHIAYLNLITKIINQIIEQNKAYPNLINGNFISLDPDKIHEMYIFAKVASDSMHEFNLIPAGQKHKIDELCEKLEKISNNLYPTFDPGQA